MRKNITILHKLGHISLLFQVYFQGIHYPVPVVWQTAQHLPPDRMILASSNANNVLKLRQMLDN